MDEQRPWHRYFALSWLDFFANQPVTVEPEKDLSVKKQLLDMLLFRKEAATLSCRLPDGFEDLATYNLATFKSHQEKLSVWALLELVGHYVNLRKQVSPSMDEDRLLPEEAFRLYAVSVRFPQQLASSNVGLRPIAEGVYEVPILTSRIRIIVANQLPLKEHNATLLLFSTREDSFAYGARHYHIRSGETSTLLQQLVLSYSEEIHLMPDLLKEFYNETIDQMLKELPVEKRLEGLTPEQILQRLTPKQRVQGLSPEELRRLADELEQNGPAAKPQ
jgi:hypothetical protein